MTRPDAYVPVAITTRSGFDESLHFGMAVGLAPGGDVAFAWGDPQALIYPRSSNKPMQAVAMLRAGLRVPERQLALVCASHDGTPMHLELARDILAGVGLDEHDLANTPDLPLDTSAAEQVLRDGGGRTSLQQNCSGKHAGMLATCVAAGWDTATYRDPGHPLQLAIADAVAELAGEPVSALAVDGCGAPVMAISLAGLARSFGAIAAAPGQEPGSAPARIATAIRNAPEYLGGTDRDVTALIRATPGLIAKDGAESVVAVGLEDGRGVAVKVADGGGRARMVILAAALRAIGVRSEALAQLEHSPVLGHGEPVGALVAVGF